MSFITRTTGQKAHGYQGEHLKDDKDDLKNHRQIHVSHVRRFYLVLAISLGDTRRIDKLGIRRIVAAAAEQILHALCLVK